MALGVWRAFRAVPVERLLTLGLLAVVLLAASSWNGIVILIVVDVVLFLTLVVENQRIEHSSSRPGDGLVSTVPPGRGGTRSTAAHDDLDGAGP